MYHNTYFYALVGRRKMKNKLIKRMLAFVLFFFTLFSCMPTGAEDADGCISEAEFVKELCDKARIKPLVPETEGDGDLAGYIQAAKVADIIDAEGFNPDADLTREKAVAMVVRTLKAMKNDLSVGESVQFEDKSEISKELLTYIEVALSNSIIDRTERFSPKSTVTYSAARKMVDDMYEDYKRLPVTANSGIMRRQFPVVEDSEAVKPSFLSDGYELVFSDDFDGDSLDETKWSYNYSWGHSHNHAAWCVPENVIVKDGILTIKGENVKHSDSEGKQGTFNNKKYDIVYTSGAINTHHKFNFDYGYFEARLKMPKGKGMWPAWWMLKDGWPPEIDMLEVLCSKPNELHVNFHYGPSWNQHSSHEQVLNLGFDTSEDFHTYGFEWTPDYMRYYVDGVQVGHDFTNKDAISQAKGMYMILNLAIDGWDGTPDASTVWPALYQCDYVRVWQKNE